MKNRKKIITILPKTMNEVLQLQRQWKFCVSSLPGDLVQVDISVNNAFNNLDRWELAARCEIRDDGCSEWRVDAHFCDVLDTEIFPHAYKLARRYRQ